MTPISLGRYDNLESLKTTINSIYEGLEAKHIIVLRPKQNPTDTPSIEIRAATIWERFRSLIRFKSSSLRLTTIQPIISQFLSDHISLLTQDSELYYKLLHIYLSPLSQREDSPPSWLKIPSLVGTVNANQDSPNVPIISTRGSGDSYVVFRVRATNHKSEISSQPSEVQDTRIAVANNLLRNLSTQFLTLAAQHLTFSLDRTDIKDLDLSEDISADIFHLFLDYQENQSLNPSLTLDQLIDLANLASELGQTELKQKILNLLIDSLNSSNYQDLLPSLLHLLSEESNSTLSFNLGMIDRLIEKCQEIEKPIHELDIDFLTTRAETCFSALYILQKIEEAKLEIEELPPISDISLEKSSYNIFYFLLRYLRNEKNFIFYLKEILERFDNLINFHDSKFIGKLVIRIRNLSSQLKLDTLNLLESEEHKDKDLAKYLRAELYKTRIRPDDHLTKTLTLYEELIKEEKSRLTTFELAIESLDESNLFDLLLFILTNITDQDSIHNQHLALQLLARVKDLSESVQIRFFNFLNIKKVEIKSSSFIFYLLAHCHNSGIGTSQNIERGFTLLIDTLNVFNLQDLISYILESPIPIIQNQSQRIVNILAKKADTLDSGAQKKLIEFLKTISSTNCLGKLLLAYLYERGIGIDKKSPQIMKETFSLYEELSSAGDPIGHVELGKCYEYGKGVEQDYQKAFDLYTLATTANVASACYLKAICHYYGRGTERNSKQAFNLIRQLAYSGNGIGFYGLGFFYKAGMYVKQDLNRALKLFVLSIDQKEPRGFYELGFCYEHGLGVKKDYNKAIELYLEAAKQGLSEAQYQLANCYKHNNQLSLALIWYRKAAQQNYEKAVKELQRLSSSH